MKKYKLMGVLLLSSTLFMGCAGNKATNNLTQTTAFDKSSTDIIYKYLKGVPKNVQVSIAKIKDGQVHYYGAIRTSEGVDIIDNHLGVFMVGSITKLFTSTLLAQMVIDDKISLNDDIQNKLPFLIHNGIGIRYKELANHTSGLVPLEPLLKNNPHYHDYIDLNYDDLEYYLKNDLSVSASKGTFSYSNLGVSILGYTLATIEGKPYNVLLKERIFDTLGMNNSTTVRANSNLVPAIIPNDEPVPVMYKSAGAILSTVEDLYKFSVAAFGDMPAYLLTQKPTAIIDDSTNIGLVWFILKKSFSNQDITFHFHGGATEGYTSILILDRENQNGIIVLSNLPSDDTTDKVTDMGFDLIGQMYK